MTMFFDGTLIAHVHVNWLAPVKVRRTLLGGSRRMIVFDDLEASEKIKVYDRGISLNPSPENIYQMLVGYRTGDMWAPQLAVAEALQRRGRAFRRLRHATGRGRTTDGEAGLRVVRLLEAATASMRTHGQPRRPCQGVVGVVIPSRRSAQPVPVDQAGDRRGGPARARQRAVHPRRRGRGVRARVRRLLRRRRGGRRELRDERAAPGAAGGGRRPRRRGDHRAVHVRRHRRRDRLRRRQAGLRRHRPETYTMAPGRPSKRRSRRARRRSCRCISTGSRPTWIRSSTSPRRHGLVGDRGCGAGARRRVPGPALRVDGRAGGFSFYPGKNLGAYGEGGARGRPAIRRWPGQIRAAAELGRGDAATSTASRASTTGWTAFRAPSCGVKLRHLEAWTEARRARAAGYARLLADAGIGLPAERPECRHVYHVYAVRLPQRDATREPRCRRPAFRPACTIRSRCTCSRRTPISATTAAIFRCREAVAREVLSLPMYPELTPRADRDRRLGASRVARGRRRPCS